MIALQSLAVIDCKPLEKCALLKRVKIELFGEYYLLIAF